MSTDIIIHSAVLHTIHARLEHEYGTPGLIRIPIFQRILLVSNSIYYRTSWADAAAMTTTTFKATAIKIIHALNTFNISELLIFTRAFSSFIQYLPSSNFTQTNKIWICIWITSNISEESIIPSLSLSYRIHWTVYAICFTKLHDLQTKKRPRPSIREKKKNGLKTKNKNERRVYWMSIQYFQLIRPFRDNKKKQC